MTDDELKQKQIELETLQNEIKKELKSRTIDKRNRKRVIFNYDTDTELKLLNNFKVIYNLIKNNNNKIISMNNSFKNMINKLQCDTE